MQTQDLRISHKQDPHTVVGGGAQVRPVEGGGNICQPLIV